ncbi:hypothetical protein DY000_02031223 [Brassica cretica]|uniref:CASP-like protein n=1 Tax=Brassica cretica TaxID=69181 RepID=A0ABQ7DMB8_BRACR|nr:hypothetical protein DY000_02031223 [Brassica cretica]
MLGTVSLWLGQSLVVFDVVFIVVGLPSIVYVRLAFIASLVALPFTMFATSGLDNVFVRVCYVGLEATGCDSGALGIYLPKLRKIWTVPWFADFVSSPLPSLFSHLVAAFITASISGGSPFRYVCQSRLFIFFPSFPWYRHVPFGFVVTLAFR